MKRERWEKKWYKACAFVSAAEPRRIQKPEIKFA